MPGWVGKLELPERFDFRGRGPFDDAGLDFATASDEALQACGLTRMTMDSSPRPVVMARSKRRTDVPVTAQVLAQAIERGAQRKDAGVRATALRYQAAHKALLVSFADASAVTLPVSNYPELSVLSVAQLKRVVLGMGGSALCLDEKDLHVSIAGLVAASAPLRCMAVTVAAARLGSRTSESKAAASRENGMKGGRPRKQSKTA